jgi:hypothetical protein
MPYEIMPFWILITICIVWAALLVLSILLMIKMWIACNHIARIADAYAPKLKKDLAIKEAIYYKELYEARLKEATKDQEESEVSNNAITE